MSWLRWKNIIMSDIPSVKCAKMCITIWHNYTVVVVLVLVVVVVLVDVDVDVVDVLVLVDVVVLVLVLVLENKIPNQLFPLHRNNEF